MDARPPTEIDDARHIELFDRLWNDLRRRDDRSEFSECASCGRAVRWVVNLGSAWGGTIQIVAKPVTTAAFYDPEQHAGLVAVFTDRTGFTVSRFTPSDEVEAAFLYPCHWDVCDHARSERDRISRERRAAAAPIDDDLTPDVDAVLRYARWLSSGADARPD
jgi:hypothetical protein